MHNWSMIFLHQSKDNRIFDAWIGEEYILDIFRVDIQAVRQHNQVFLTSFQIEISFSILKSQITRMVPPIFEGSGSGLRVLPVARRYIRSLDQEFTISRDAYLHTWNRLT